MTEVKTYTLGRSWLVGRFSRIERYCKCWSL